VWEIVESLQTALKRFRGIVDELKEAKRNARQLGIPPDSSYQDPARGHRPILTHQAHVRAHGRMPTQASGPACEGRHENARRAGRMTNGATVQA